MRTKHAARIVMLVAMLPAACADRSPASPTPISTPGVRIFEARVMADSGPVRPDDTATAYASTTVQLPAGTRYRAVISGSADGSAPWAVDNYLFINNRPVCTNRGPAEARNSCFGESIPDTPRRDWPIETVRTLIAPVDVSALIPRGTAVLTIELRDAGGSLGNTDVYLAVEAR
jgi:hypothetical protein